MAQEKSDRDRSHRSPNTFWAEGKISAAQREERNGHIGCIVCLTGPSAAGKITIAAGLERRLFEQDHQTYVLDGDHLRRGLNSDLAFSPSDRKGNIRRVGEVAKLMADTGMIVIAAFISPYRSDPNQVRSVMPDRRFVEVHVRPPLAVCEERDPKGLYARARAGQITDFTGISAPYEAPESPEVVFNTAECSPDECVQAIALFLGGIDRRIE